MPEHLRTIRIPLDNGSVVTMRLADEPRLDRRIDSLTEQVNRLSNRCGTTENDLRRLRDNAQANATELSARCANLETETEALSARTDKLESDSAEMSTKHDWLAKALRRIALSGEFDSHLIKELLMAGAITPEEIAELWPDIVAICEPDDGWLVLAQGTSSTASALAQASDGIIRNVTGIGTDYTSVSMAGIKHLYYLNMAGIKRLFLSQNRNWSSIAALGGPATYGDSVQIETISNCINMGDLETLKQFNCDGVAASLRKIRGKWKTPKLTSMSQFICHWGGEPLIEELPEEIDTSAVTDFFQALRGMNHINRFPELDLSSCNTLWGTIMNMYNGKNVRLRLRNLGTQRGYDHSHCHLRVYDWNYSDMIYSLVEASVDRSEKGSAASILTLDLHSSSYVKLTIEDKAAIVAKGYTLIASDY